MQGNALKMTLFPSVDKQCAVNDVKTDIITHEWHAVLTCSVLLVVRTRVKGQCL